MIISLYDHMITKDATSRHLPAPHRKPITVDIVKVWPKSANETGLLIIDGALGDQRLLIEGWCLETQQVHVCGRDVREATSARIIPEL